MPRRTVGATLVPAPAPMDNIKPYYLYLSATDYLKQDHALWLRVDLVLRFLFFLVQARNISRSGYYSCGFWFCLIVTAAGLQLRIVF